MFSQAINDNSAQTFSQAKENSETIGKYFHAKKNSDMSLGEFNREFSNGNLSSLHLNATNFLN